MDTVGGGGGGGGGDAMHDNNKDNIDTAKAGSTSPTREEEEEAATTIDDNINSSTMELTNTTNPNKRRRPNDDDDEQENVGENHQYSGGFDVGCGSGSGSGNDGKNNNSSGGGGQTDTIQPSSHEEEDITAHHQPKAETSKTAKPTTKPKVVDVPWGPVFYPTVEDMKGSPLVYLEKIRPVAQRYGIAKIVPPEGWSTDFFGTWPGHHM